VLIFLLGIQPCFGSGFFLIEQSVTAMGSAYAGGAALAQDATTIFFNPAGMSRIAHPELVLGVHLVAPEAHFDDQGSRHLVRPLGRGLGRDEGGNAGETGLVPNLYYAHPLSDRFVLGLGIGFPFGLVTDYDSDEWIGRYHATRSGLTDTNINPSLSWRLSEALTIGAGISYAHLSADIGNMLDIGGILPAVGRRLGTRFDSELTVKGADSGWGYNLGVLFEPWEHTRVGMHYRSRIDLKLEGKAEIDPPGGPLVGGTIGAQLSEIGTKSRTQLPAMASLSVFHRLDKSWAVMADVTWMDWSKIRQLAFDFDGILPTGVEQLDWEDTFRYAIGAEYRPDTRWTWRAGLALDTTPIPNPASRTPRLPDEDRLWTTLGLGYQYSERMRFDLGYAHLFVRTSEIDRIDSLSVARIKGRYDAQVNILSAQLTWHFL
jgi:long-chain fatty acid transport protein